MKVLAGVVIGAVLMGAAVSSGAVSINCADMWKNYYCAVKTPWSFTVTKTP